MEKYLQEPWHYNNEYDRATIKELKALEKTVIEEQEKVDKGLVTDQTCLKQAIDYFEEARHVSFKIKPGVISKWMESDRNKDRLVASNPIPSNIRCNTCGSLMAFDLNIFKNDDRDILFVFHCPKQHIPKKMVYADGREFPIKISVCKKCGGGLVSTSLRKDKTIIFTDTCKVCGYSETSEMEDDNEEPHPINEDDRKKYCTDFIDNSPSARLLKPLENLLPILNIIREIEDTKEKNKLYNVDDVERLNIPQLEQRLTDVLQNASFIKIQFDKPKFGKHASLEFSAQDPTNRDAKRVPRHLGRLYHNRF
jgi:hypothetical protein